MTTDEDINKRLFEYNQLLDYFDPVESSDMELVINWDTQQAYQINSCGNWGSEWIIYKYESRIV
ncbi:hypothetical protein [Gracilibacillus alcaliphilus]|uniref:hypothetical protein n=1 Tax=Gracilibacillus alcaliphilus TaxID=1401441 RepID=UPI001956AA46|nr:hypothetical protein [Gracilibacillus alcaliphilus]MBM7676198.1 pantothenate kinase-related protein Tda10 [Gracilibacillus alcaliphilus]